MTKRMILLFLDKMGNCNSDDKEILMLKLKILQLEAERQIKQESERRKSLRNPFASRRFSGCIDTLSIGYENSDGISVADDCGMSPANINPGDIYRILDSIPTTNGIKITIINTADKSDIIDLEYITETSGKWYIAQSLENRSGLISDVKGSKDPGDYHFSCHNQSFAEFIKKIESLSSSISPQQNSFESYSNSPPESNLMNCSVTTLKQSDTANYFSSSP